jgi:hypothetical protein
MFINKVLVRNYSLLIVPCSAFSHQGPQRQSRTFTAKITVQQKITSAAAPR